MLVRSGTRSFRISEITVSVSAGQGIVIPAGVVHTPLAMTDNVTTCVNIYVATDHVSSSFRLFDISHAPVNADNITPDDISRLASNTLFESPPLPIWKNSSSGVRAALSNSDERISDIAAGFDRSREGFSRQVKRELGLAPHEFRILSRLNRARHLLREGHPIAAVAADVGFSDQSHMTRLFRQTFGTTPGLYWRT